jgi:hypothetical protein
LLSGYFFYRKKGEKMEKLVNLGVFLAGLGVFFAGIAFLYWGSLYEKKIKLLEQKKKNNLNTV